MKINLKFLENYKKIEIFTFCDKYLLDKFEKINFSMKMEILKFDIKKEILKINKKIKNKNGIILKCFIKNENFENNCYIGKNEKYYFYIFSFFEFYKENKNFCQNLFKKMNFEILKKIQNQIQNFSFFFIKQKKPNKYSFKSFDNNWQEIHINNPLYDFNIDDWVNQYFFNEKLIRFCEEEKNGDFVEREDKILNN